MMRPLGAWHDADRGNPARVFVLFFCFSSRARAKPKNARGKVRGVIGSFPPGSASTRKKPAPRGLALERDMRMDMADTGLAVSGTAFGVIGTIAVALIKARFSGGRKAAERVTVSPDPLRVEIQKTYATKEELRELEDRFERKLDKTLDAIREDVQSLRRDIQATDEKAEARTIATHKRIDVIKDLCASRARGGCK